MLLPFAMWQALPASDYYGSSASLPFVGVTLPCHAGRLSPVHMVDVLRMSEVADRSLYPCILQVVTGTSLQLRTMTGLGLQPYMYRRLSWVVSLRVSLPNL